MTIPTTSVVIKKQIVTVLPDSVIDSIIAMVYERVGTCLESSYGESTAEVIFNAMVCHFLEVMGSPGAIKQEKSANGASVSYEQMGSGEGLRMTQWGNVVLMTDTSQCYLGLVNTPLLFTTIGNC